MGDRLGNVQALRGVACLCVVLYHAAESERSFGLSFQPLRPALRFGYAGVDLFFTLSGFVLAYVHRDWFGRPGRVPAFLFRRLWRIYPTYWAVLPLAVAWWTALGSGDPFVPGRGEKFWRAVALVPEQLGVGQIWLPQAWTLSHELAFYAAFAALIALPRRIAAVALLVWFAAVVALQAGAHLPENRFSVLWAGPYTIEFLLGAAVGWCLRPGWARWSRPMLAAAALWLAAGVAATYGPDHVWLAGNRLRRVSVWGVPSALLLAALAAADLAGRKPLPGWLQRLGEASYSVYLVHLLTQSIVFSIWIELDLGHRRVMHACWTLVTVSSALGVGWLVHRFVERPLQDLMRRGRAPGTAGDRPAERSMFGPMRLAWTGRVARR